MTIKFSLLFVLFLLFVGTPTATAQKPCPANFDGQSLLAIKNKIKKHTGETIAFDAQVVEVKQGYNNVPYFSVMLENGELLWISSMVSDKYVSPKAKLRLLGYIELVQKDDAIANQYHKVGYHIRVFAMLDHATKQMQISNAFDAEVSEWVAGHIPSDIK